MIIGKTLIQLSIVQPDISDHCITHSITIERFPFLVGRQYSLSSEAMDPPVSLAIADKQPYQLSRRHFMIDYNKTEIIIRDCSSHNGTIVNNKILGRGGKSFEAILVRGENKIIAGNLISPFQFICQIS